MGVGRIGVKAVQRFVVLGDSISEGIGDAVEGQKMIGAFDLSRHAWVNDDPARQFTNLAYRGLLAHEVCDQQLARALVLQPDVASVTAGANDALKRQWDAARYSQVMTEMFSALIQQGAKVFTATWLNSTQRLKLDAERREMLKYRLKEGNAITRKLAGQAGAVLVDFWEHPIDHDTRFWSADGIYSNALGYQEIALSFRDVMARQLGVDVQLPFSTTLGPGS